LENQFGDLGALLDEVAALAFVADLGGSLEFFEED
jgi:hypothetical protein